MGKKRCKKAQMTAFILIGIILLAGASILTYVFYISKKAPTNEIISEKLPETLDKLSLDALMTSCIKKASDVQLIRIGKYGGTINPKANEYRIYNHTEFRYLCEQKAGYSKCVNRALTRARMQEELQEKIRNDVMACVAPALKFYNDRGYDIETGEVSSRVIIAVDDVNVIVTYPIVASKGTSKISVSDYSVKFNYPLGKLYDITMEIINSENSIEYFNQEQWMYNHSVEVLIQKHRPYPDIVYRISEYNWQKKSWYILNFALQGYDSLPELAGVGAIGTSGQQLSTPLAARSNAYDQDLGCCYNSNDGNCFENGDKTSCSDKGLEWRRGSCQQSGFVCKPISKDKIANEPGMCNGRKCRNCMDSSYKDGDDVNDPKTYTGPARKHGESWCMYEGPAGHGLDAVGSRHYKYLCIDGNVLVEECRDYRDEICTDEVLEEGSKALAGAVCRPNRWQDCHLFSGNKDECMDTEKRDCYWSEMQDTFVLGKPSDEDPWPTTPYEGRYCVPAVPPGFRFWNTMEAMQVCGWANNYYECAPPGCNQEWFDFDAAFCAMQGDCGIYRNYIGELPKISMANTFPGSENIPSLSKDLMGGGFGGIVTELLFERVLPNKDNFRSRFYQNMDELPAYPKQWGQKEVTPDMFIHNSPNDYSMIGIMSFIQEFARWGMDRVNHADSEIMDLLMHDDPIDWDTLGVTTCGVWTAATSGTDCEKCNNNPYRPCTEYKCRSLGMFCNYEEKDGVGICTSYESATIGKPIVKFNGHITPSYTEKKSTLNAPNDVFIGIEIKEPLATDYTFQIKTNRETQCKLTLLPGVGFGLNPTFPGTAGEYSFSTLHNLTIPYLSAETLSVMLVPLELMTMINMNPDQLWSMVDNIASQMISLVSDTAEECHDCNPYDLTKCGDMRYVFLSESDCDDMDKTENNMQTTFSEIKNLWNSQLRDQINLFFNAAKDNAVDEILMYAAQHKYHAFIKCRDRGGSENDADLDFVRFKVSPTPLPPTPEPPDTAPVITAMSPVNWTEPTAEADGKVPLYIITDRLAECSYSKDKTKTTSIIYMENKFTCPKSTYEGGFVGGYLCNASLPLSDLTAEAAPLYIKCADHPEHYETYNFRLEQDASFSGPTRSIWLPPESGQPGTLIIRDPRKINQSIPTIKVPTASVKLFLEFNTEEHDSEKTLECRYGTSATQLASGGNKLVDPATGSNECDNCTAILSVGTGTDYYVSCHFKTTPRNEGEAMQYVLKAS